MVSELIARNHHQAEDYTMSRVVFETLALGEHDKMQLLRDADAARLGQADPKDFKKWVAETFPGDPSKGNAAPVRFGDED